MSYRRLKGQLHRKPQCNFLPSEKERRSTAHLHSIAGWVAIPLWKTLLRIVSQDSLMEWRAKPDVNLYASRQEETPRRFLKKSSSAKQQLGRLQMLLSEI